MFCRKKIKVGKRFIDALLVRLASKNLVVLKGSKGYVMCGYLNLKAAEKFKDAAVKIVGIATIEEALKAKVFAYTSSAKKMGIYPGQSVKEALKIIV